MLNFHNVAGFSRLHHIDHPGDEEDPRYALNFQVRVGGTARVSFYPPSKNHLAYTSSLWIYKGI